VLASVGLPQRAAALARAAPRQGRPFRSLRRAAIPPPRACACVPAHRPRRQLGGAIGRSGGIGGRGIARVGGVPHGPCAAGSRRAPGRERGRRCGAQPLNPAVVFEIPHRVGRALHGG
jgi:hypothetical protein